MTSNRKVGNVDVFVDAHGFVNAIQLTGRPLYLTSDPAILKKQFRGETLDPAPRFPRFTATSPPTPSSKPIRTAITTTTGWAPSSCAHWAVAAWSNPAISG